MQGCCLTPISPFTPFPLAICRFWENCPSPCHENRKAVPVLSQLQHSEKASPALYMLITVAQAPVQGKQDNRTRPQDRVRESWSCCAMGMGVIPNPQLPQETAGKMKAGELQHSLGRAASVPHLGSTVELALVKRVQVSRLREESRKELTLACHSSVLR